MQLSNVVKSRIVQRGLGSCLVFGISLINPAQAQENVPINLNSQNCYVVIADDSGEVQEQTSCVETSLISKTTHIITIGEESYTIEEFIAQYEELRNRLNTLVGKYNDNKDQLSQQSTELTNLKARLEYYETGLVNVDGVDMGFQEFFDHTQESREDLIDENNELRNKSNGLLESLKWYHYVILAGSSLLTGLIWLSTSLYEENKRLKSINGV